MASYGKGSKGPVVEQLQHYLKNKGFNPGTIDGVWGPNTQKAYEAFIKKGGKVDWKALEKKAGATSKTGGKKVTGGASEDEIIQRMLDSEFGPLIKPFVKVDELRPLLINLAPVKWGGKGWTEERFLAAVKATKWWNKKAGAELAWGTMTQGEKDAAIRQQASAMFDFLQQNAGQDWVVKHGYANQFKKIDSPGGKLRYWAWKVASGQMSYEQWQVTITQKLLKDTTTEIAVNDLERRENLARRAKRPEEMAEEIWQEAHGDYFIHMSKASAKKWADNIINGKSSFGELKDFLRAEAAKLYKGYSQSIANGVLPKQLFGPALGVLANELEMSEEQVIADGKLWGEITAQAAGQKDHFTASDWVRYARAMPVWKNTRGARQMSSDFGERLLKQFGAVA